MLKNAKYWKLPLQCIKYQVISTLGILTQIEQIQFCLCYSIDHLLNAMIEKVLSFAFCSKSIYSTQKDHYLWLKGLVKKCFNLFTDENVQKGLIEKVGTFPKLIKTFLMHHILKCLHMNTSYSSRKFLWSVHFTSYIHSKLMNYFNIWNIQSSLSQLYLTFSITSDVISHLI